MSCIAMLLTAPIFANEAPSAPLQNQNQKTIHWQTNYNQAMSAAKKANKPVLLFFTGSDWCGWCKKMDKEVFSQPEFAQLVGNDFIFVELDYPMKNTLPSEQQELNNKLKQQYGVTGFPTVILLDANGNFVAESGYRPGGPKAYADYLKGLMK